jgi:3-deoxy-manno-octulosonate cytidylyltransferase (CMP-KDO synthetase)
LPEGKLETVERLEQLRVLENGFDIKVALTDEPSIGIDTLNDAELFEEHLNRI